MLFYNLSFPGLIAQCLPRFGGDFFMGQNMKLYFRNLGRMLTQVLNALTGGDPDEYFSSRIGKARIRGSAIGTVLANSVDFVFKLFGNEDHCFNAIEPDEGANEVWRL